MRFPLLALCACLLAGPASADLLGLDNKDDEAREYRGLPKFRLAVDGGYSRWIFDPDSVSGDFSDYYNSLENGTALSIQAVWFPWLKGGLGGEWIWFLTHASAHAKDLYPGSGTLWDRTERASFVYWGATFCSRVRAGPRGLLQANFGAGYLDILDDWIENGARAVVTAHNLALSTSVDYDWTLNAWLALGLQGRFIFSNVNDYVYNGKKVHLDNPSGPDEFATIQMYRLELAAGLRFQL